MTIDELVNEIKVDLGSDINSLGISDESIRLKINEAMRKVCSYAPYVCVDTYSLSGNSVELPAGTCMVSQILTNNLSTSNTNRSSPMYDEADLFNATRYTFNTGNILADPYIYMMNITEMQTLQNMVSLDDWYYNKDNHTVYFSNPPSQSVVIKSLQKYESFEKITDPDIIQVIKEYSLALCKIIEGNIRRKLQSAPGAIQMDGDSLVSEGTSEKARLDDIIPKQFQNVYFGIRV